MKWESHMLVFNLYATRDSFESVVWRYRWTYARALVVRNLAYQDKTPRLVQAAICLLEHARHTQAPHRQQWSFSVAPATSVDFALFVDIRVSSQPRTGREDTGLAATAYVNKCQLSWTEVLGGKFGEALISSRWFGVRGSSPSGSRTTGVRGREFMDSTSTMTVTKPSSVTVFWVNNAPNIFLTERIKRSQTPPMWLAS